MYGRLEYIIEQINNTAGAVTYLHHDQAGSTRLLTGSTGTVTGKCTYSAYGTPTCEGTTTTPIGYDAQYTTPDTGLIYLRNRVYDPTTAQFMTVDPIEAISRAPYNYADDNPLNYADPLGLSGESIGEVPSCPPGICLPFPNGQETERAIEAAKELGHEIGHSVEGVFNSVFGESESSSENRRLDRVRTCVGTSRRAMTPIRGPKARHRGLKSPAKTSTILTVGSGIGTPLIVGTTDTGTTNQGSRGMRNGKRCFHD